MPELARIATFASLALAVACAMPTPSGPRIERADPEAEDPYAGTALSSKDLIEAARFVVTETDRALGDPMPERPWRLRLERIDNFTSMSIDPALIAGQIFARANRDAAGRLEFYDPHGELFGSALSSEQARGVRSGEAPPAQLVTPDFVLFGTIREHAVNSSAGLSRFVQLSFSVTDLTGRVIWSDVVVSKKHEARHPVYQ